MADLIAQIKKTKTKLEELQAEGDGNGILSILETLEKEPVTIEVIKETRIGKAVGKLRKHSDTRVSKKSLDIVELWKKVIEPVVPKTSPPIASPKVEIIGEKRKEIEREDNNRAKKAKTKGGQAEDVRGKVVALIQESLGEKFEGDLDPKEVAIDIENELYKQFGDTNREYKAKVRSLSFNLKNPKNPMLKTSVLQGIITVSKLCSMTTQEMAPEELKKERERITKFHIEAAQMKNLNQTSTDMFKCGKCGKRETTYYQMQTRSADEPMTTFHTCCNCGNRWKS